MYIWSSPGLLTSCGKQLKVPDMAIVKCCICLWQHNGGSQKKGMEGSTHKSVFCCSRIPFIIRMCEKLQNCCYLFFFMRKPPHSQLPYSRHVIMNMERSVRMFFGEGAVDFRDADYVPEVHRIMFVFELVVPSACQRRDRCRCVLFSTVGMRRAIHINATNTVIHAPSLSYSPLLITINAWKFAAWLN